MVSFVRQTNTREVRWRVTDTQTDRPNYRNPRCACAPRVNKILHTSLPHLGRMLEYNPQFQKHRSCDRRRLGIKWTTKLHFYRKRNMLFMMWRPYIIHCYVLIIGIHVLGMVYYSEIFSSCWYGCLTKCCNHPQQEMCPHQSISHHCGGKVEVALQWYNQTLSTCIDEHNMHQCRL